MKSPLLKPRPRTAPMAIAAAVLMALALGVGKPARAEAAVTEEQAAAATFAATLDAAAAEESSVTGVSDTQIVETVVWSESDEAPSWFPSLQDQPDLRLTPSPIQPVNL